MHTALGLILPYHPEDIQASLARERRVLQALSVRTSALIRRNSLAAGTPAQRAELSTVINNHLMRLVSKHSDIFRAYADLPVNPSEMSPAIEELERIQEASEFVGVLMETSYEGTYLDDEAFAGFLERADAIELTILLHPTVPVEPGGLLDSALYAIVGFPAETNVAIARMMYSGFFDRYPNIRFITTHGGTLPWLWWRLNTAYEENWRGCQSRMEHEPSYYLRRLFYDTTMLDGPSVEHMHGRVGDQIVIGTDHPYADTQRLFDEISQLGIGDRAREAIFYGTASRVLGLTGGSSSSE